MEPANGRRDIEAEGNPPYRDGIFDETVSSRFDFSANIMRMKMLVFPLVTCCLLAVALAGCTHQKVPKSLSMPRNPLTKNKPKTPHRMVDVWNTYAQTDPDGGKPIRGLAGRVLFFPEGKAKKAVKVDGKMTVFVFDGKVSDPAHSKPLKQYVFPPATLESHYSYKEPLGHGYDFFLPFDEIGGAEKTLCVMARFDDDLKGQFVMSQPVTTVLQGASPEAAMQEMLAAVQSPTGSRPGNNALLAGYTQAATGKASGESEAAINTKESIRQVGLIVPQRESAAVASIPIPDNYARHPIDLRNDDANTGRSFGRDTIVTADGKQMNDATSQVTYAAATIGGNGSFGMHAAPIQPATSPASASYAAPPGYMLVPINAQTPAETKRFDAIAASMMRFPAATVPDSSLESRQARSEPYQLPGTFAPAAQSFGFGAGNPPSPATAALSGISNPPANGSARVLYAP